MEHCHHMTIPAGNNYCPSCQEICHDHPSICTVCGAALQVPPAPAAADNPPQRNTNRAAANEADGFRVVPNHLMDEIRQSTQELTQLLRRVNEQVEETRQTQQELMASLQGIRREMAIPAALLDPSNHTVQGRPTAEKTLRELPRIQLEANSSLFFQASLSFLNERQELITMHAVPGELAGVAAQDNDSDDKNALSHLTCQLDDAVLVVAEPRTGKGGALSTETLQNIQQLPKVVVYMERGDGVTFVQKAMLAQKAGAQAVVIGNNQASPWPYIMRDSKGEAKQLGLRIPVLMVKQQDGRVITKSRPVACCLKVEQQRNKDCVICTDSFDVGQTVIQLPVCGHVFHDACASRWLERHNTCPYCRRELPTDDADYEQERRRVNRTHAGSESRQERPWNSFYG